MRVEPVDELDLDLVAVRLVEDLVPGPGPQRERHVLHTDLSEPVSDLARALAILADLLRVLEGVNTDASAARIPKDLPVHLASGDKDPVGANGKGVRQVADQLRRLGVKDVTMTLWPEARHEILNETNRDEVEIEIVNWLDAHLVPAAA